MCCRWTLKTWRGEYDPAYNLGMREVGGSWGGPASEPGSQSLLSLLWHTGYQVGSKECSLQCSLAELTEMLHHQSSQDRAYYLPTVQLSWTYFPLVWLWEALECTKEEESKERVSEVAFASMGRSFSHAESITFSQLSGLRFSLQCPTRAAGPNLWAQYCKWRHQCWVQG